jgi:hypothetical protein
MLLVLRNLLNSLLVKLGPLSVKSLFGAALIALKMLLRTVIDDVAVFLLVATAQAFLEWWSITTCMNLAFVLLADEPITTVSIAINSRGFSGDSSGCSCPNG